MATQENKVQNSRSVKHLHVALGLDVDRDAPFPKPGLIHGVSLSLFSQSVRDLQDPHNSALFEGTTKGLQYLLDELDRTIPKIFFFEGRTALYLSEEHPDLLSRIGKHTAIIGSHGMDHEDLLGTESKLPLSIDDSFEIIAKGVQAVETAIGTKPKAFRAPYMRIDQALIEKLPRLGIRIDSSRYLETTKPPVPFCISKHPQSLFEIPIVKYPETDRKFIYLYLWSLFEQQRLPEDYIKVLYALSQNERATETAGICLVNLHPWHLAYNIVEKRYLSNHEIEENLRLLHTILDEISDKQEIEFQIPEYISENKG
ncbi:MAG: polysaccharide deacetylase family protein [Candidatus Hodarchaeales archaeon]